MKDISDALSGFSEEKETYTVIEKKKQIEEVIMLSDA